MFTGGDMLKMLSRVKLDGKCLCKFDGEDYLICKTLTGMQLLHEGFGGSGAAVFYLTVVGTKVLELLGEKNG